MIEFVLREVAVIYISGLLGFLLVAAFDVKGHRMFTTFEIIRHSFIWPYHAFRGFRMLWKGYIAK
jgi:hypothetical protein